MNILIIKAFFFLIFQTKTSIKGRRYQKEGKKMQYKKERTKKKGQTMIYKTLQRKIPTLQWSKEKITNNDLQNTTQKNTDIAMVKGKNSKQ
jgi:hypothetical protein